MSGMATSVPLAESANLDLQPIPQLSDAWCIAILIKKGLASSIAKDTDSAPPLAELVEKLSTEALSVVNDLVASEKLYTNAPATAGKRTSIRQGAICTLSACKEATAK